MAVFKIFELAARSRKEAMKKVSTISNNIQEEIIKLVVYKNSTASQHWKGKIFGYLDAINEVKTSKGHLSQKDYQFALNPDNFEDGGDFFPRLVEFYADYCGPDHNKTKEYPEFKLDHKYSEECYQYFKKLLDLSIPVFCGKSSQSFEDIVQEVFEDIK